MIAPTVDPAYLTKPHVKALGDHLVLVPVPRTKNELTQTASGIFLDVRKSSGGIDLPDEVDNAEQEGYVVALGDGFIEGCLTCFPNGRQHQFEVKIGDRVLFSPWAAMTITIEEQDFYIVTERDVLGIVS